jgi:hypothetical protein
VDNQADAKNLLIRIQKLKETLNEGENSPNEEKRQKDLERCFSLFLHSRSYDD